MDFMLIIKLGGIHVEYIVYWRSEPKDVYKEELCKDEETLAITIQNLRVNWNDMTQLNPLEMMVLPNFKSGQLVLNIKTLQTRIVKSVQHSHWGNHTLVVYNHDCPDKAELQKYGYVPRIHEEWDIRDCVLVDWQKARTEHNFQFGTAMGKHERYLEMEAREMSSW